MKMTIQPLVITVLFGMIVALAFLPVTTTLASVVSWTISFRLIFWLVLVGYALLLALWGQGQVKLMVIPLLLLFCLALVEKVNPVFVLACLGVLSWIRSSVVFQKSLIGMSVSEGVLSLGGGALVGYFMPPTRLGWALGIWMFFLIQSLYFLTWEHRQSDTADAEGVDPFEHANRQAEKILATLN